MMDPLKDTVFESFQTPVKGDYDLIVCGAGMSGIAAAVAARRCGLKRVLIIEKSFVPGGLATAGLISLYEPIDNGAGEKMIYGMASELMQLCRRYGADNLAKEWEGDPDRAENPSGRYKAYFSPTVFTLALERFLIEEGVELLYDTMIVRPLTEKDRITAVVVENKSGRGIYRASYFVDATGDAQLFFQAGIPCVNGSNCLTYIYQRMDLQSAEKIVETRDVFHLRSWVNVGGNVHGEHHPEGFPHLSGTTAEELTAYMIKGRELAFNSICGDDRKSRDIVSMPMMPQIRRIRRIDGSFVYREENLGDHFSDSISTMVDFLHAGVQYEIPYRILYHPDLANVYTAGRSVSADGWAWDLVRTIPCSVATGQAAGSAAALLFEKGCSAKDLPAEDLQKSLVNQGVRLYADLK